MVKALFLGLFAAMMCGLACTAPAPQLDQLNRRDAALIMMPSMSPSGPPLEEDPAARSERSTNLSHVTGTARKIQMFIKNRHLQLLPDGIVNGTTDATSGYTYLQRITVGIGQIKIQGVVTCQYLCMDSCGLLYGSREFGDECIFNEMIEQHHYNTYSSRKYSNQNGTLYLALNKHGRPRKVLLEAKKQLGRLSSYTRVLTRSVKTEQSEDIHPVRHHAHACSSTSESNNGRVPPTTTGQHVDPPRCRRRRKRKKKKRKCPENELDNPRCRKKQTTAKHRKMQSRLGKKCENDNSDECQRDVKKKHKNNINSAKTLPNGPKKRKNKKGGKKGQQQVISSTESTLSTTLTAEDVTPDEDYGLDTTTHSEWEDSTAIPDMSMSMSSGATSSAAPD